MRPVELTRDEWAAFATRVPEATLFQTERWLGLLEEAFGCDVLRLGFLRGEQLVGGIPVPLRRKAFYRIAGARGLATAYQGPLALDESISAVFAAFWEYERRAGWDFVEIALEPDSAAAAWDGRPLEVRSAVGRTVRVDLTLGEDALFRAFEQSCRAAVRQAQRADLHLTTVTCGPGDWIDVYFPIAQEMYRRQGRPPTIPRRFFERLWAAFESSGVVRVVLAEHRGRVIAGAVFLVYGSTLYYCDGVSVVADRKLRPNNLIQWEIIRWACREGLRTYDMLGADIAGIAQFKKGFGGEFVPYTSFTHVQGWLARFGEAVYRALVPYARQVAARAGVR
jgi:hypothetical protein